MLLVIKFPLFQLYSHNLHSSPLPYYSSHMSTSHLVSFSLPGGEMPEGADGRLSDLLAVAGRDDGAHQGLDAAHLAHCHLKKTKNKILGIFQIKITLVF